MSRAYYNEHDAFAAAWLEELIGFGLIAPGDVDRRSIEDVTADDLRGYDQHHFFAGIGVWSRALREASWPDDRPVWTGSCPCQPFSTAGQGGGFADERHLWPSWHWLIEQHRPPVIFGEQVASKPGLGWFDLVSTDLEDTGYAVGAADLGAASVGAPHIRQRLWFVAHDNDQRQHPLSERRFHDEEHHPEPCGAVVDPASEQAGLPRRPREPRSALAHDDDARLEGRPRAGGGGGEDELPPRACGLAGPLQHAEGDGRIEWRAEPSWRRLARGWGEADWIACRDGKWRQVEPGTFPLAHGAPCRVGRLRGYGNAICLPVATAFIEAAIDALGRP
jgi:DNA (cytosine-5)-methyltransferase 1